MRGKHLFLFALLMALCFVMLAPSASFARFPDRPIQLVIAYVPGATGDITARMLAEELEKIIGSD